MKTDELMKSLKILYVEDEPEAREEMADVLKRRAGKLYVADNGKKGLALAEDHEPDIVVADLYMPEMNGLEMIREIRALGQNPSVIIVSAIDDVDTIIGAIDVGVHKYILKPVNISELLEVLAEQTQEIFCRRRQEASQMPENRKLVEDEIKREFAAFLKAETGKGPKDVKVFLGDDRIEVVASDVLTVLERSILESGKNTGVVKHVREVFFSSKEQQMCRRLSEIAGCEVLLKEAVIHVEKNKNRLLFVKKT